jgi:integrase
VAIPPPIGPELTRHISEFAEEGADGLVFVGPLGGRLRRHNFRKLWLRALADAGLGDRGVHFRDLRHTGNHLAAITGASTRELLARMGHSSVRAAMIYQLATREIARAMRVHLDPDAPERADNGSIRVQALSVGSPLPTT